MVIAPYPAHPVPRKPDEVPPVPPIEELIKVEQAAQEALKDLVDGAGGRFKASGQIPTGHTNALVRYLDWWARPQAKPTAVGLIYNGHPGTWRALDKLYPLLAPKLGRKPPRTPARPPAGSA